MYWWSKKEKKEKKKEGSTPHGATFLFYFLFYYIISFNQYWFPLISSTGLTVTPISGETVHSFFKLDKII